MICSFIQLFIYTTNTSSYSLANSLTYSLTHSLPHLLTIPLLYFYSGVVPDVYIVPVGISYDKIVDGNFSNEQMVRLMVWNFSNII